MTTSYPKGSGSLPAAGRKGRKAREETTGNLYRHRPMLGKSMETRMNQRMNVYGKVSPAPNTSGLYESPLRTIRSPVP